MINKRGISENLHRYSNKDGEDQRLASLLPGFLIKKIEKDELSQYKQTLFLEDETEEDPLEIKMDQYLLKEPLNMVSFYFK